MDAVLHQVLSGQCGALHPMKAKELRKRACRYTLL